PSDPVNSTAERELAKRTRMLGSCCSRRGKAGALNVSARIAGAAIVTVSDGCDAERSMRGNICCHPGPRSAGHALAASAHKAVSFICISSCVNLWRASARQRTGKPRKLPAGRIAWEIDLAAKPRREDAKENRSLAQSSELAGEPVGRRRSGLRKRRALAANQESATLTEALSA